MDSFSVLQYQLPATYYSKKCQSYFHQLYLPHKVQSKRFAQLIKDNCPSTMSAEVLAVICLEISIAYLMICNLPKKATDLVELQKQFVSPLASSYPDLFANALEELDTVIDYFAFGSEQLNPLAKAVVYRFSGIRLQLLLKAAKAALLQHQIFFILPTTPFSNLQDWKKLFDKKFSLITNPLDYICRSRELSIAKKYFKAYHQDFCWQRFCITKSVQLREAFDGMSNINRAIKASLGKEFSKHLVSDIPPIEIYSFNVLDEIINSKGSIMSIICLPSFFRLVLDQQSFDKLSSMYLRETLFDIETRIFPQLNPRKREYQSLQLAADFLSDLKLKVYQKWLQVLEEGKPLLSQYSTSFNNTELTDPSISLYALTTTMQLVIETCSDYVIPQHWVEAISSLIRILKPFVTDKDICQRIEILLDSTETLLSP